MRWEGRTFLLFLGSLILAVATPAFAADIQEEGIEKDIQVEPPLTIIPGGFGSIKLGTPEEEVWKVVQRDGRYERVSKKLWEKIPFNPIIFAGQSCSVHWGFQNNILPRITIHFPYHPLPSCGNQLMEARLAAQSLLKNLFGTPDQTELLNLSDFPPVDACCTDRWVFPNETEIRVMVFRHEALYRIYAVGIEIADRKESEIKRRR